MSVDSIEESATHHLPERAAQAALLVRSVEEADRRGQWLSVDARRDATARAGERKGWPGRRALLLADVLAKGDVGVERLRRWTRLGRGLALPLAVAAFVAGLATNALGPERQVHVLALPLLGIIAWNVAMLVLLLAGRLLPFRGDGKPKLLATLEGMVRSRLERLPAPRARQEPTEEDDAKTFRDMRRATIRVFTREWLAAGAPLAAARLRRALHLASLALVAGVVAGMYLRGVAFAYHAAWESTFLSAGAADRLLGIVLGPAAAVLGTTVPSVSEIGAQAVDAAGPDAGPWIHLWAMTAALFVGLPRAVLVVLESLRTVARGRRIAVELPAFYLRRLRSAASTDAPRLEVVPYSYRPPAAAADTLKARLHDLVGARAEIRLRPPLDYGADLDVPAPGRAWVVLYNLGQTPELEVHGAVLRELHEALPDGQALLAIADASAWREKLPSGEAGERRLDERRRAWDRLAAELELPLVHLDLRRDSADNILAALARGAWPPGSFEGG